MKNIDESCRFHRRYKTLLNYQSGSPWIATLTAALLLVVFLICASGALTRVSAVKVKLPQADMQAEKIQLNNRGIVTLTCPEPGLPLGRVYFQQKELDGNDINALSIVLDNVNRQDIGDCLIIQADKQVPYERIMQVMSVAENRNLKSYLRMEEFKDKEVVDYESTPK